MFPGVPLHAADPPDGCAAAFELDAPLIDMARYLEYLQARLRGAGAGDRRAARAARCPSPPSTHPWSSTAPASEPASWWATPRSSRSAGSTWWSRTRASRTSSWRIAGRTGVGLLVSPRRARRAGRRGPAGCGRSRARTRPSRGASSSAVLPSSRGWRRARVLEEQVGLRPVRPSVRARGRGAARRPLHAQLRPRPQRGQPVVGLRGRAPGAAAACCPVRLPGGRPGSPNGSRRLHRMRRDRAGAADGGRRARRRDEVRDAALRAIAAVEPHLNAVVGGPYEDAAGGPTGRSPGCPSRSRTRCRRRGGRSGSGAACSTATWPAGGRRWRSRFRAAGLVSLVRTATPEFAFNIDTAAVVHGPTLNPWDPARAARAARAGARRRWSRPERCRWVTATTAAGRSGSPPPGAAWSG